MHERGRAKGASEIALLAGRAEPASPRVRARIARVAHRHRCTNAGTRTGTRETRTCKRAEACMHAMC
eukprot:11063282-Alexandrium_andersonii.AAC.1